MMFNVNELREKVELGLKYCKTRDPDICHTCPYYDTQECFNAITIDALKIADYWKSRLADVRMSIDTKPVAIMQLDSMDIRKAKKASKSMAKLGNAAIFATEALKETTKALRALKEELNDIDEE